MLQIYLLDNLYLQQSSNSIYLSPHITLTMSQNYCLYNPSRHTEEARSYTAICVWESWLEHPTPLTEKYKNSYGTAQLRQRAIDLSPTILTIFDELIKMEAKKMICLDSFDWDLVPAIYTSLEIEYDWLGSHPDSVPCGSELKRLATIIAVKLV